MVYKFHCVLCNESCYTECIRHLAVRSDEHIGVLPLINKRVQPRKDVLPAIIFKLQMFTHF